MTRPQNHDHPPRVSAPATGPRPGRPRPEMTVPKRSSGRVYALAWIAAGLLSAGYVATIIRQPEAVTDIVMRPDVPTANVGRLAHNLSRTEADVQVLKQAVTSLQGGLIDVKSRADAFDIREKQLAERVGAVETRVDQFAVASIGAPAADPAKPARPAVAAAAAVPQPPPPQAAPAKQPPAKTAVAPTVINQKQAKPIETASIPVPAPGQRDLVEQRQAAGPVNPAAALADTPHGVVVASGPSIDALRLSWSLLSDRHKAALGKMEPRVVTTDGNTYQLIAGPLPSDAEASKVCAGLKARGIACRPAEYRGDAL